MSMLLSLVDSLIVVLSPVADFAHSDIAVLKTYGAAPYATALKNLEKQIKDKQQSVNDKIGVKVGSYCDPERVLLWNRSDVAQESDTGLAPPHLWDVAADRQ